MERPSELFRNQFTVSAGYTPEAEREAVLEDWIPDQENSKVRKLGKLTDWGFFLGIPKFPFGRIVKITMYLCVHVHICLCVMSILPWKKKQRQTSPIQWMLCKSHYQGSLKVLPKISYGGGWWHYHMPAWVWARDTHWKAFTFQPSPPAWQKKKKKKKRICMCSKWPSYLYTMRSWNFISTWN